MLVYSHADVRFRFVRMDNGVSTQISPFREPFAAFFAYVRSFTFAPALMYVAVVNLKEGVGTGGL